MVRQKPSKHEHGSQQWAAGATLMGVLVSVYGNVADTAGWHSVLAADAFSVFWPLALFATFEVVLRTDWQQSGAWQVVRLTMLGAVAIGAGTISYSHLSDLLSVLQNGHSLKLLPAWWEPSIGPVVIDGMMIVCAWAMLETRSAKRKSTLTPPPKVNRTESTAPEKSTLVAPKSTVPAQRKSTPQSLTPLTSISKSTSPESTAPAAAALTFGVNKEVNGVNAQAGSIGGSPEGVDSYRQVNVPDQWVSMLRRLEVNGRPSAVQAHQIIDGVFESTPTGSQAPVKTLTELTQRDAGWCSRQWKTRVQAAAAVDSVDDTEEFQKVFDR